VPEVRGHAQQVGAPDLHVMRYDDAPFEVPAGIASEPPQDRLVLEVPVRPGRPIRVCGPAGTSTPTCGRPPQAGCCSRVANGAARIGSSGTVWARGVARREQRSANATSGCCIREIRAGRVQAGIQLIDAHAIHQSRSHRRPMATAGSGLLVKLCWSADVGRAPFGLARAEGPF
jgi:hypothetical protein